MKYNVETLKQQGYKGIQLNNWTGNKLKADYVLDNIAWTMNNKPERLCFKNDDVKGKVYITIKNENWTPALSYERYAERDMSESELREADKRLSKIGMIVNRNIAE